MDKLAIIQSEETIKELDIIDKKTTELVATFKNLYTETERINKMFLSGKPKDYSEGLKEMEEAVKKLASAQKQTQVIQNNLNKLEIEQARLRKENANATAAESRAEMASNNTKKSAILLASQQEKQLAKNVTTYKQFSKEVLDAKNRAKDLGAEMIILEQRFRNGEISKRKYNSQLNILSKEFTEAKVKALGLDTQIKKLDSSVGDNQRDVGNYKSAIGGLATSFRSVLGAFGIAGGITMFADLALSSFETIKTLNAQNLALNQVFESEAQVAYQREFLADITNRYGMELKTTTDGYIKYSAAVKGTALEGEKARDIYASFSGASAKLGLSAEQNTGIFKALEQMISKGKIQAEELRGQLGDRMAGAFKLFADGIGVSTSELDNMLKKGEVIADDVLPKVSDRLNEVYSLSTSDNIDTVAAAQQRLSNQWTTFLLTITENKELMNYLSDFIEGLGELLGFALDVLVVKGEDGRSVMSDLVYVLESLSGTFILMLENLGLVSDELQDSSKKTLSFMDNMEQLKTTINLVTDTVIYLADTLGSLFALADGWNAFSNKVGDSVDKYANAIDKYNEKTDEIASRTDQSEGAIYMRNLKAETAKYTKEWDKAKAAKKAYFQYNGKYYASSTGKNTNKSLDDYLDVNNSLVAKQKNNPSSKIQSTKTTKSKKVRDTSVADAKKAQQEAERIEREKYELEKDNIEKLYKVREEALKNNLQLAKDDPYSTETGKIDEQNRVYNELIKSNEEYYNALIDNAKAYNQDKFISDFETTRDTKDTSLQGDRNSVNLKRPEAAQEDLAYMQNISDLASQAGFEEGKRLILTNEKLSQKDKEYQLSILELQNELKILNIEKEKVSARQKELQDKATLGQLTQEEKTEWAEIAVKAGEVENSILHTSKTLEQTQFDKIAEGFAPVVDLITNGFNDLGLNNIANQFSSMYQRILSEGKEFSMTTADYMNAGAALVTDFANQLVEQQTAKRTAELDEQLRISQETTDQEIGFIEGRLERLNALDELSQEQIEERNALEAEARTLREQQLQREKQIEAQKAKAIQRAQAQQVLIAGFQAGVMAFASQLIPGDPTSLVRASIAAAAAIGFAGVNAALIMSKDPVPQYFVGRDGGKAEWAWTQEKGAELHTDKKGNIKSYGSDGGAKMTWLDEGDKIYTASQTKDILNGLNDGNNIGWGGIAKKGMTMPIIINQTSDNSEKIISGVGKEFDKVFKKYDKTVYFEDENGYLYSQNGGQYPINRGKKRVQPQSVQIKLRNNGRD